MNPKKIILVTGATGYIGGRLVPRLLEKGYIVRCLARKPENLQGRPWSDKVEIVGGDVCCSLGLEEAFRGVDAAYYLIHSMSDTPDFEALEAEAAENFARAALSAGIRKIIYLGGLGAQDSVLSKHLSSRHMVGEILRKKGLSVTEFRAAMIVGAGSVSFEILRYLAERLPLIPCFKYLSSTRCQPIAIRDVLSYLLHSLENPASDGKIIEIGGPGVYAYRDMLQTYAGIRGLTRCFFNIFSPSPELAARFVGFVTPVPAVLARPLLQSLANDLICSNKTALEIFPEIQPLDFQTSVQYALARVSEGSVETSWTAAYVPHYALPCSLFDSEGMIVEDRRLEVNTSPERVYEVFCGIGGERGWFAFNFLWTLRAVLDRLFGGIGMRRGRRHPDTIHQGEVLDFWRVERVVQNRTLLLRAEMKLPGKGWLQFEVIPVAGNKSLLRQTAYFEPRGLFGYLYWYSLYPLHKIIFSRLAAEIRSRSEGLEN